MIAIHVIYYRFQWSALALAHSPAQLNDETSPTVHKVWFGYHCGLGRFFFEPPLPPKQDKIMY